MPSNHTTNYQLSQWVKSDQVLMDDFNADNAKIDAALASKASASALNSLKSTVNGKASQAALDSLSATVSGHTAALSGKGNCQLYTTSYTGTGKNDTPKSITFPGQPWVVFVGGGNARLVIVRGAQYAAAAVETSLYRNTITWNGNSVSWYHDGSGRESGMLNASGTTYRVVALLQAD